VVVAPTTATKTTGVKKSAPPSSLASPTGNAPAAVAKPPPVAPPTHLFGAAAVNLLDLCGGSSQFRAHAPVLPVYPGVYMPASAVPRNPLAPVVITSAPVAPPSGPADPFAIQTALDPYTKANTHLSVDVVALVPPGRRALPMPNQVEHKFARVIYVLRYDDDARLKPLLATLADMNAKAMQMEHLPRRALVNVQLTPEQRADSSDLDIITGFTVMDTEFRILCFEVRLHMRFMAHADETCLC
jgi:hypothetical protein